ncbi:hypothetical protein D9611_008221 [Ephemerocybe angulata]|uniref:Uncharacterized protein n=1 Tax=Ephemerocybe angulata TaxID=980116 RepID=A0A8H5BIJ7_9AGAR|nr:hypothetical protein D9611_008221 [Tulosesus angulatus]
MRAKEEGGQAAKDETSAGECTGAASQYREADSSSIDKNCGAEGHRRKEEHSSKNTGRRMEGRKK